MSDLDAKILYELSKSLVLLGAKSDLLSIVGSWNDTLESIEILELIKVWNNAKKQELISITNYLDRTDN
jgi:predicted transcriptional regulator